MSSCASVPRDQDTSSPPDDYTILTTQGLKIDSNNYWHVFEFEERVLISNNPELFVLPPDVRVIATEDVFLQLFISENQNIEIVYDLLLEEEFDAEIIRDVMNEFFDIVIADDFEYYWQDEVVVLEYSESELDNTNTTAVQIQKLLLIKPLVNNLRAIMIGETPRSSASFAKKSRILALMQSLTSVAIL